MYPPRRWQWESHHDRGSASTTNPLQRLNEVRRWALASRVARVLSWRKRLGVLRILRKACFHPVAVQESQQPIGRLAEPHAVVRFHAPDYRSRREYESHRGLDGELRTTKNTTRPSNNKTLGSSILPRKSGEIGEKMTFPRIVPSVFVIQ